MVSEKNLKKNKKMPEHKFIFVFLQYSPHFIVIIKNFKKIIINFFNCHLGGSPTHKILKCIKLGCDHYGYEGMEHLCTQPKANPVVSVIYFVSFVLFSAMMILNLFIGVITSSMQDAKFDLDEESKTLTSDEDSEEDDDLEDRLNDLFNALTSITREVEEFLLKEKERKACILKQQEPLPFSDLSENADSALDHKIEMIARDGILKSCNQASFNAISLHVMPSNISENPHDKHEEKLHTFYNVSSPLQKKCSHEKSEEPQSEKGSEIGALNTSPSSEVTTSEIQSVSNPKPHPTSIVSTESTESGLTECKPLLTQTTKTKRPGVEIVSPDKLAQRFHSSETEEKSEESSLENLEKQLVDQVPRASSVSDLDSLLRELDEHAKEQNVVRLPPIKPNASTQTKNHSG